LKEATFSTGTVKKSMARPLETQDHCGLELFAHELIHESRNCSNMHSLPRILPGETLLMQHDVEQRTVDFQPTAIVDGAQLSEPIHREFRSGAGVVTAISAPCILAYLRNYVLRVSLRFLQQRRGPRLQQS
jgi:hypothetical protein